MLKIFGDLLGRSTLMSKLDDLKLVVFDDEGAPPLCSDAEWRIGNAVHEGRFDVRRGIDVVYFLRGSGFRELAVRTRVARVIMKGGIVKNGCIEDGENNGLIYDGSHFLHGHVANMYDGLYFLGRPFDEGSPKVERHNSIWKVESRFPGFLPGEGPGIEVEKESVSNLDWINLRKAACNGSLKVQAEKVPAWNVWKRGVSLGSSWRWESRRKKKAE